MYEWGSIRLSRVSFQQSNLALAHRPVGLAPALILTLSRVKKDEINVHIN